MPTVEAMKTFRYLPPGTEEQRAFVLQCLGTLLGLLLVGLLVVCWVRDPTVKGVMWGAGLGTVYLLARAAWQLERKAQRSQSAEIGVDDAGLHLTDGKSGTRLVRWEDITECGITGGRLTVTWAGGTLMVGAREVENGMDLVRAATHQWKSHHRGADDPPPSNFIPLEPR